jgi:hypothetical protein
VSSQDQDHLIQYESVRGRPQKSRYVWTFTVVALAGGLIGSAAAFAGFASLVLILAFWLIGPLLCGIFVRGPRVLAAFIFNCLTICVPLGIRLVPFGYTHPYVPDGEKRRLAVMFAIMIGFAFSAAQLARVIPQKSQGD